METKFTNQYLDYIDVFLECLNTGQLINISKIYNDYSRPKNKSPQRVLKTALFRDLVMDEIQENNYEIENVIRYDGKDIYVSYEIAIQFLHTIDRENLHQLTKYVCKNYGIGKIWDSIPKNDNQSGDGYDYTELPF
jgi:hypothetical protein